jgi:hypothetical protein
MPSSNMHPCLFLVEWKHSELGVRDMTDTTITFKANAGGTHKKHGQIYIFLFDEVVSRNDIESIWDHHKKDK